MQPVTFSDQSLLVVDTTGRLKRMVCPFQVKVKRDVLQLRTDEIHTVQCVKMDEEMIPVYFIQGKSYYFWCFTILDNS